MGNILSFLLEYGGCSIQYRIKRKIMNVDPSSSELQNLQKQILNKPKVIKILEKRQVDGWIGNELHGGRGKGLDSSVSFLIDNGVERDSKIMRDVITALLSENKDVSYRITFKGGEALDIGGRGGNRAVKAGILADLGEEDNAFVQNEMEISLCYLRDSLKYNSINDFSEVNKKGVRYYKKDAHFPGANHLNLLSATNSWRSAENVEMVKTSMTHCFNIMQEHSHNITFKADTHFVGPFNFNWNLAEFNISKTEEDSYALVWWLRNLNKMSKIGVIQEVVNLKKSYDYLYELVKSKDLLYKQSEASLKRFKDILSVENSWRKKESIYCDVMFYGVMILYNAGYDVESL